MAKQKRTAHHGKNTSNPYGAIGSGPAQRRFISRKKIFIFAPILVVAVGAYVVLANDYFGIFGAKKDADKGLIYTTEIKESPAPATPAPVVEGQLPSAPTSTEEAEASVEGESTDAPVRTNQLPESEEKAVEDAARVDTAVDSHEVETMGGGN